MIEQETYDIYYDEAGNFLEITLGVPSKTEYSDEIEPGVFITKDEETNEIKGIGILDFKKRCHILSETLKKMNINFPLNISCP